MRVRFSPGGGEECLHLKAVEWRGTSECMLRVFMCTFLSPGRRRGRTSHLWLLSSDDLVCVCVCVCVCVYFQFRASPSHLRLLFFHRLGSGLGRLVALEVHFPYFLWSFSPQNNLLNIGGKYALRQLCITYNDRSLCLTKVWNAFPSSYWILNIETSALFTSTSTW